MRHCVWLLGLLSLFSLATHASDWQEIKDEAKGQTVWFNAWGGDTAINRYLDWVSGEMKTHYAINLKIVRLADAADAVKRIQTEATAGRKTGGSVDLLWVNGENFRTLKEANLLQTDWAETLPNWRYVDTQLPVREDFSVPTEGAESPWGGAQLTFIARRDLTPQPPQTPQALLEFAKANPGTVTYPRPPDFTGTAFLEQLLIMLTPEPGALKEAPAGMAKGRKVKVVNGLGKFTGANTLEVEGENGKTVINFDNAIIAAGVLMISFQTLPLAAASGENGVTPPTPATTTRR